VGIFLCLESPDFAVCLQKIEKWSGPSIYTLFYEKIPICTKTPEMIAENNSLSNTLNLRHNFATLAKIFRNVPYTRQSYIKGETGYL